MKTVLMTVAVALLYTSQALAASAFYTNLGVYNSDGKRYPGIMVAIGADDLCATLSDEMKSELTHAWVKKAVAFVAIRASKYPIGGSFNVTSDDWTAESRPTVTATAYDVRYDDSGTFNFSHRVQAGRVILAEGDVINQEPLRLTLDFDFPEGGPHVDKNIVATYCPAYAALTQLWTNPG